MAIKILKVTDSVGEQLTVRVESVDVSESDEPIAYIYSSIKYNGSLEKEDGEWKFARDQTDSFFKNLATQINLYF